MILVLEHDGSDVTVVGLYSDLPIAVNTIIAEEHARAAQYLDDPDAAQEFAEQTEQLRDAVRSAVEQEHGAPVIDFQIESPFLSVDLEFKSVELSG